VTSPVYLELVDFIAASNPESLIHFELSASARARLADLARRKETLTAEELAELEQSAEMEQILLVAKAKARANREPNQISPLRSRAEGFQPISIRGEPFSQTIIEGR